MSGCGVKPLVRKQVLARAGGACELCGRGDANNVHHRRPRGMGGTRLEWVNEPPNLLFVCGSGTTGCHGFLESNRLQAYEMGWLLRMGMMADQVPFTDLAGRWWLLRGVEKWPVEFGFTPPPPPDRPVNPGAVRLARPERG